MLAVTHLAREAIGLYNGGKDRKDAQPREYLLIPSRPDVMAPRFSSLTALLSFSLLSWSAVAAPAPSSTSGTVPSAVLQSCAAQMNGALPSTTPNGFQFSGNVRRYYVAAEEVDWNYAPTGWDNWLGVSPLRSAVTALAR